MFIMLLEASIPVSALVSVLLAISGAVALIALAVFFFKAASLLGQTGKLIKDISPGIEETVGQLPAVVENLEIISGNLVDISDDLADTTPVLLDDVEAVMDAVGATADALSLVVTGISGGVASLFGGKRKKAKDKSTVNQVIGIATAVYGLMNQLKKQDKKKKKDKKK